MKDKRLIEMKALRNKGFSYSHIGKLFKISRQRVFQLLQVKTKPGTKEWLESKRRIK